MPQELQQDAEKLYEAVTRLVKVYQFRDKERICCHGISLTQWSALAHLVEHGPMNLNALAELLTFDKSTTSRVVDGLVRKELVGRVENPEDRRAVRLAVNNQGNALFHRIRADIVAEEENLIADLAPDVRKAAIELIERLTCSARRRLGGESDCVPVAAVEADG